MERFILAHTILFSMEGIPAIYIQNYLGSKNDNAKVKKLTVLDLLIEEIGILIVWLRFFKINQI